jgi:hypothetical protein
MPKPKQYRPKGSNSNAGFCLFIALVIAIAGAVGVWLITS